MMRLEVGTSGYGYKEWKGSFYPQGLAAKEMLRFYAARLPAVEINTTFYAMPRFGVLKTWAEQVPPHFQFALKAPRKITHLDPLKGKEEELAYLFKTAAVLDGRLGAILFQLPPHLGRATALLADFLGLLPASPNIAFEFRHPSWFEDEIYDLLQKKGCALCCCDSEDAELSRWVATADWGYVRLRKASYSETDLRAWARRITSQNWHTVFVFFKHEASGAGPLSAQRLLDLLGSGV